MSESYLTPIIFSNVMFILTKEVKIIHKGISNYVNICNVKPWVFPMRGIAIMMCGQCPMKYFTEHTMNIIVINALKSKEKGRLNCVALEERHKKVNICRSLIRGKLYSKC